ncbi:MAG: DUF760 domain-containing protein [Thermostichales cyanobacterium SZTDM-1c_bins_54]
MSNPMNFLPGFEGIPTPGPENALWHYLQSQSPEVFQEVAQASSPEVLEVLGYNIRSLLGSLPGDQFGVQIVTNRENLARLLSGAMMGGYFLRVMEQRHQLERSLKAEETQKSESQNTAQ